jgi:hypothetical protein
MPEDQDLSETIANAAGGPKAGTTDGFSVESHPLPDLIAADKYLGAKAAAKKKRKGLGFIKLIPEGEG